jgi:hypothetical protein
MSYVKKIGNEYFLYESYREDGKVKKKYIGMANPFQIIVYNIKQYFKHRKNGKNKK